MFTQTQSLERGHTIMQDLIITDKPQGVVSRVRSSTGTKYAAAGAAFTVASLALVPQASAADLTTTSAAPTDMVDAAKEGLVTVANDGKTILLFAAGAGLVLITLNVLWSKAKGGIKSLRGN